MVLRGPPRTDGVVLVDTLCCSTQLESKVGRSYWRSSIREDLPPPTALSVGKENSERVLDMVSLSHI